MERIVYRKKQAVSLRRVLETGQMTQQLGALATQS